MYDEGVILKTVLNFTCIVSFKKYVAAGMIAEGASKKDFAFFKTPDQPLLMCVKMSRNCIGLCQVSQCNGLQHGSFLSGKNRINGLWN